MQTAQLIIFVASAIASALLILALAMRISYKDGAKVRLEEIERAYQQGVNDGVQANLATADMAAFNRIFNGATLDEINRETIGRN